MDFTDELAGITELLQEVVEFLAQQSEASLCQQPDCSACQSADFHQAYQRGGSEVVAHYESIPGVTNLREAFELARAKITITG